MGKNYLDVYNHNILDKRILRRLLERVGLNREDSKDLLVYSDATYKQDIYVQGLLKGNISVDAVVSEAQDFKVYKDLVVQDDATIKNDLVLESKTHSTGDIILEGDNVTRSIYMWDPTNMAGVNPVEIRMGWQDSANYLRIYDELGNRVFETAGGAAATSIVGKLVIANLGGTQHIETPRIFGTYASLILRSYTSGGATILLRPEDILLRSDSTFSSKLAVEDDRDLKVKKGITEDFTTQGIVFKIVKGLIVNAHYKSG